jgi:nucleotide-binding universal stress UspA family protein
MMQIRRILFPIDFSEACVVMASSVREMAQRFNGSVMVLNAFNAVPEYIHGLSLDDTGDTENGPVPYSPALLELRGKTARRLEEFSRTHFPGVSHTEKIADGDPVNVIKWVAKREDSELIMMPTKGLGRFRRLLLGSVTAKVLHDIDCPVFTSAHQPELNSGSPTGYRSIVCAVEMSHEDDAVFKAAVFFAQAFNASVCLLHIHSSSSEDGNLATLQSIRNAFDRACNAGEGGMTADVCARILDSPVPEGIRQIALEEDADLVIVGRGHARETFSSAWSNLYTIIRESPCPVLSV